MTVTSAGESFVSDSEAKGMLQQILRKQEESLDLNGQLVLINEKMDKLIAAIESKIKPQGAIAALVESSPQIPLFIFIVVLVALFLGFGPELVGLLGGASEKARHPPCHIHACPIASIHHRLHQRLCLRREAGACAV